MVSRNTTPSLCILVRPLEKGKKTLIQDVAAQRGQRSLNGYIKNAVETKIKADTGKDTEL